MTTADWAFVISLVSVVISLCSFGWNVWSKFIFPKPRVRVNFAMVNIYGPDLTTHYKLLRLTAVNHGPSDVKLTTALMLFRKFRFGTSSFGILNVLPAAINPANVSDHDARPFGGGLGTKVGVGEELAIYLIPDHEALARGDYERIGLGDSFGRMHWAPRRNILETLPHIREECLRSGKQWRNPR